MLKHSVRVAGVLALLAVPGLAWAEGPPQATPKLMARATHALAAAIDHNCRLELGQPCSVGDLERLPVVADVVRYRFKVRIGPGPFDVIRMHRVVKEQRPFVPVHATEALFALHGCCTGFEGSFLANILTGQRPPKQAMPVYLAQRGVDVWGVDLGWILAPKATTDFSSFGDWGFDKEVSQTRAGMAIARGVRAATSGDAGRMDFLGWSYGAQIGYVLVAEESQLPGWRRHVKGFIPVDMVMKYEPGTVPDWICPSAEWYQSRQDSGDYKDDMSSMGTVGTLAINDPAGESPIYPPLTNEQVALLQGAGLMGLTPTAHMVAGIFDETGLPTGFQFTGKDYFFHFLAGGISGAGRVWWAPVLAGVDQLNTLCGAIDVPFDDHLGDVRVPTLNLAAAGGIGQASVYSATLLGSPDVTTRIVSLRPPGEEALDFGHADLWLADNAEKIVWRPILDWLKKH
jgi:hypothetical protein